MKTDRTLLDRVVEYALETPSKAFDEGAVSAAKLFLSDTLACALAGSDSIHHRAMVQAFSVNQGLFTAPGRSERLVRDDTAVLTAHSIHCLEWDAVHEPAVTHAMSVTTGALYADAQALITVSGRDFLEAVIVGVDLASRLGVAADGALRFFRPATAGLIGAAAAVARLRGMPTAITKHALGLAYSQVQGTMQAHLEGTPTLAVQVALSSRAALNACDMAAAGMTAPQDIFEGPFGYFKLIEDGGDLNAALDGLGKHFAINDLSIKPYSSGRASHGILSTVFKYMENKVVTAETFAGLKAKVPPLVHRLVGRPVKNEMTTAYARLCAPYLVGLALRDGRIDPRRFSDADFAEPVIQRAAAKVSVEIDTNPDLNALAPQEVSIELKDGRIITDTIPAVLGAPGNPVTQAQLDDKFAFSASIAASALNSKTTQELRNTLQNLDGLAEMQTLYSLFTRT